MFGWQERWKEGKGWRGRCIPLFSWKEDGRERRGRGRNSPSKPPNLNPSISGKIHQIHHFFYEKSILPPKSIIKNYTNWLYSYGVNYIKNNTNYTNEEVMQSYLKAYYNLERKSLYEDKDGASVLKPTKLCIDYFEFIADL